jgi:hypothetical protein
MPDWRARTPSHPGRMRTSAPGSALRPRADTDSAVRHTLRPGSDRPSATEVPIRPRLDPPLADSKCILPCVCPPLDNQDHHRRAGGCRTGAPAWRARGLGWRSGSRVSPPPVVARRSGARDRGAHPVGWRSGSPGAASARGGMAIRVSGCRLRPRRGADPVHRAHRAPAVRCRSGPSSSPRARGGCRSGSSSPPCARGGVRLWRPRREGTARADRVRGTL